MRIFLGPSGSPKPSTLEGLGEVRRLGLDAMELSFTHGVRMSLETARAIGEANTSLGLQLSIHAPYYVNLCSEDDGICAASQKRILDTVERAAAIGAGKVVFHAAYYGKRDHRDVFEMVSRAVTEMGAVIKKNRWNVELLPETSGRHSQFGSLDEILTLARQAGCSLCIDVAHLYARNNGVIDYRALFGRIEEEKLQHVHFHFEGIAVNKGGEGRHLPITGNPPDFTSFGRELLRCGIDATIISESPLTWQDSLVMRKILERLGHQFK